MLHAAFRYAGSRPRAHPRDRHRARRGRCPACSRSSPTADVPDVRYGGFVQDRTLFAKRRRALRGRGRRRGRRARRPRSPSAAAALIEVDYEPLPGRDRPRGSARRRRAARARGLGRATRPTTMSSATATTRSRSTIVKGDVDAGDGRAPTSSSRSATSPTARTPCRSSRARSSRSGRATRSRSGRRRRCRSSPARGVADDARAAREPRCASSCRILGGGFGGKCEFHFEAHVAALARAAGRPVRLVFYAPRGVHRSRPPPRGHGHRARDRRHEATARSSPAAARLILDNGAYSADAPFFPQMAAMHASARTGSRTCTSTPPGLHQHAAVGLGARAHGAAGLLGAGAAHWTRSPRRSAWIRSSSAAGTSSRRATRARPARCSSRSALPEALERAAEMIGYGQELPDGRGDRRRVRLVADLRDGRRART